jgi:hypothetical protein
MPGTYQAQHDKVSQVQKKLRREIEKLRREDIQAREKLVALGKLDEVFTMATQEKDALMDKTRIHV